MQNVLLTKINKSEFLEAVRMQALLLKDAAKPMLSSINSSIVEDPSWMQLAKDKEQKTIRALKKFSGLKNLPKFVEQAGLSLTKFNEYHFRVKNPKTGKFVDWWTGKRKIMMTIDKKTQSQGKDGSFLLQEISKLAE